MVRRTEGAVKLVEYVPDYVLRDLRLTDGRTGLKIGMEVTVLAGSSVSVQMPKMPVRHKWGYNTAEDRRVTITNFLPGRTDVYAGADGKHAVHNHQVVWVVNNALGQPWEYHSTDINNVKEVRDAPERHGG
jgi:hypothetical protein